MQQRAPWLPAAPTAALVCRCAPHAAASLNAMYQTAVADAHPPSPHRAAQRDCRRGLSSLSWWAVDHRINCAVSAAFCDSHDTVYVLVIATVAVCCHGCGGLSRLPLYTRRVAVAGPALLPFITRSAATIVTLIAAMCYIHPL
jgi:hypothetical protein